PSRRLRVRRALLPRRRARAHRGADRVRGNPRPFPAHRACRRSGAPSIAPRPRPRPPSARPRGVREGGMTWKRYPYTPAWGDPAWFGFPACDGDARRLGVQTYFVCGFLRGASTGTHYAFLTVFTDARLAGGAQRFSFYSL